MRLVALVLLAAAAALALPASAAADHPRLGDNPHGDPRSALPDSLVIQPVAQAEMGAIEPETLGAPGPSLPETWCGAETTTENTANQTVSASTPHFKLIYAHASDQPNRFGDLPSRTDDQFANRLQATVSLLGRYLATQSGERKAVRWDMGSSCATNPERYVDIQVVHLDRDLAYYNADTNGRFQRLDEDVRRLIGAPPRGPGSGPRNLVIYADGFFKPNPDGSGIGGQGSIYRGPLTPEADEKTFPWHNAGGLTSTIYGPLNPPTNGYAWPSPMLHEMTHNMGAVQVSAPNTSGAGHCDDRYDVMCYPDGGSSYVETTPCPLGSGAMNETYDCGGDDYFNPAPAAGSYLATHWNLYDSAHLAPCSESYVTCGVAPPPDTTRPTNTTPAAATGWRTSAYTVTLSGSDTESAIDAYEWQIGSGTVQTTQTATVSGDGVHTLRTRVRDAALNWSDWREETVRIDGTRPAAAHGCPEAWRAGAASCSATGTDAGSGVARLEYQVGSGPTQTITGGSGSIAVSAAGETPVRVRSVDVAGNVTDTWSTGTVRIDGTPPTAGVDCADGWHADAVPCTVTGGDGQSGLKTLTWRVGTGGVLSGPSGSTVSVTAGGVTNVTATATDNVDRTASAGDTASRDVTPPTAGVVCPDAWSAGDVTCTISAGDAHSGLRSLTWRVGSGPEQPIAPGSSVTVSVEGASTVTATATDNVDRTTSAGDTARVDKTAPSAGVSCPATWSTTSATCTITGGDGTGGSGLKTLSWRVNGGALQTGPSGSTVVVSTHGATTITASAIDNVDRASTTATGTARVDKQAPSVAVDCPDAWSADAVTCTITAADSHSGLKSLTWRVNGGPQQTGPSGSTVLVDTHGAQDVVATATDQLDQAAQATDTARVDRTPPSAAVTCPSDWSAESVTCTIGGGDGAGGSGLKSLTWRVDGGAVRTGSSVTLDTHGAHTISATATDNVDRTGTATGTARVDRVAPTVSVSCPDAWSTTTVTCTINGSDAGSGLQSLSWRIGDGGWESGPDGSTVEVATDGEHTLQATGTDRVGRTASTSDQARVDSTPPTVLLTCPATWQAARTACEVIASDPESGISERRVRVGSTGDGVAWTSAGMPFEGEQTVSALARNGAGTATAWSTPVTSRLDLTAPQAGLTCQAVDNGRHRCTPTAADAHSGIAEARLVRDGVLGAAVSHGQSFELDGPATVAIAATDRVGRASTSGAVQLAGPVRSAQETAASSPPPADTPVAPPPPPPPPPPPAPQPQRAVGTAAIKAGSRSLGSGVLELIAGAAGRQVIAELRPARLPKGTWKLKLCVSGAKCAEKTVRLRRPGKPAVLRSAMPAPQGEVRATFTVLRKVGARFKRHAAGATSVKLG